MKNHASWSLCGLSLLTVAACGLLPLESSGAVPESEQGVAADLWPEGQMPGPRTADPQEDLPARKDGVRRITNISHPTLAVFPATAPGSPAVIVCPGGGYNYVTYDKEGTAVAAWLNANGVGAIVLSYRVPQNREGALQDLQRALSLARARATDWKLDPARLGVMGFSAGGHLCAKAGALDGRRAYTLIDDIDAYDCRPDFSVLVYPAYLGRDGKVHADLHSEEGLPPTLIVQTEDDAVFIEGTKAYAKMLAAENPRNRFLLYPAGGHGYGLRGGGEVRNWPVACLEWLGAVGLR